MGSVQTRLAQPSWVRIPPLPIKPTVKNLTGGVPEWSNGVDRGSTGLRLREFKSHRHQLPITILMGSVPERLNGVDSGSTDLCLRGFESHHYHNYSLDS